jgi:hypothetical protein
VRLGLSASSRPLHGAISLGFALLLWLLGTQPAAAQDPAAVQRAFEAGMQAAAAGDLDTAITIFEDLSRQTDAPRIRLELGRALFLHGDYRRSRAQFLDVYRRDLPYPVRRFVNLFLDDIDQRIGFIQPQFGLVIDSNPSRSGASGTYQVLGAPLDYQSNGGPAVGVSYRIEALHPLRRGRQTQWQAVGALNGVQIAPRSAAYVAGSIGVRYDQLARGSRTTLGWRGYKSDSLGSSTPFVEYHHRTRQGRAGQLTLQASAELNRFPGRAALNGATARGFVAYARDFGPNTSGQAQLGGSVSDIKDSLLPRTTLFGQMGVSRRLRTAKTNLVASVALAASDYGARDFVFGERRRDVDARLDLALYTARPVWGFFPGVALSFDHRASNIDFYGYDQGGLSFDLRRRF